MAFTSPNKYANFSFLFVLILDATKTCPSGLYGPGCLDTCSCPVNAKCSFVNGSCTCKPGWMGSDCSLPCQQGYYGDQCEETCECYNGALCHHIKGCECRPGWSGQLCNETCQVRGTERSLRLQWKEFKKSMKNALTELAFDGIVTPKYSDFFVQYFVLLWSINNLFNLIIHQSFDSVLFSKM